MGFIKDAKAKSIAEQAARAIAEGRLVFACRVNEGGWNDNWGGSLSGVAEQIEAVESTGWLLDQSTFLPGKGQNVSAFLIFRRTAAPQPSQSVVPQAYQGQQPAAPPYQGRQGQPGPAWGLQG
ncbi:hypothetical protein ACWGJB_31040 [Streptomyces sp. NPDC054813]